MTQYNLLAPDVEIPRGGQGLIQGIAGPLGDWLEQRPVREARRSLATLGQTDPIAAANKLLAVDDLEGARTLANLGMAQEDRKFRQSQAESDRDWKERNFTADQAYKQQYLGILGDRASNREVPSGYRATPDGGLSFIPGGPADPTTAGAQAAAREKPPTGYRYSQSDPNTLEPIPGGPGQKIAAETAARIGLANSFQGQIPDQKDAQGKTVPGLESRVKAGAATGPFDYLMGSYGLGEPGEVHRQLASGAEALLRNLTGAGMNLEEAKAYANRYMPTWRDNAESMSTKLQQLNRELNSVGEVVGRGRGGMSNPQMPQQGPAQNAPIPQQPSRAPQSGGMGVQPAQAFQGVQPGPNGGKNQTRAPQGNAAAVLQQARAALQAGADRNAVIQRLVQAGIDPAGL